MYKKCFVALLLMLIDSISFGQGKNTNKQVEKMVATVVKKVMPATVKIAAFDTLSQTLAVSRFSGVVVSADGLILTAAHANQPRQIYQVCFPNGLKVLAKGLGRISLGKDKPATDVAMMQIIEKGKWPFAEMAYSSEMRVGQPCVGISFPGTFEQQLPNIRLGRIENTEISKGNFQSSCKMEPGDSGGALFDAKARLIGIHSWILADEKQNFEVPIDLYRKYWDALHIPVSYDDVPKANAIKTVLDGKVDSIPPLDLLDKLTAAETSAVVNISNVLNGRLTYLSGTVIQLNDQENAAGYVITKNAMIGDQILVGSKQFPAKVIYRDVENDLVLLSVNGDIPKGINLFQNKNTKAIPLGRLLFSPLGDQKIRTGIVSTGEIEMKLKYSIGYFGAGADYINDKVTITEIAKGSPADGIVQKFDQILAINHVVLNQPEQYGTELAKYYPNDTISVDAIRQEKKISYQVRLGIWRTNGHTADAFPGGRSLRSDGYKKVIVQDAAIKPNECGGPVFDANSRFIGINIGRHSRTSTVIMPVELINEFCNRYLEQVVHHNQVK